MTTQKWQTFRSRYAPCILPILYYWSWDMKEKVGINVGKIVNIWDKGNYQAIWSEYGINNLSSYTFNILEKNINNLDEIREEGIIAGEKVIAVCKSFAEKSSKKDLKFEEYLQFLKNLEKSINYFTEKSMILWIFTGGFVEQKIRKLLVDNIDKEEIISIMSLPEEESYSQKEEGEFYTLLEIIKKKGINSDKSKKGIKKFSEKYYWFPYEYIGPNIWDDETVTNRINQAIKDNLQHKNFENPSEKQKECIKKYNLSKELIDLFKIMRIVTLMQDDRKMINSHTCYYINGIIIKNLSEKLSLNAKEGYYIEEQLLKKIIESDNLEEARKDAKEREEFCVIIQDKIKKITFIGKEAREKLKELGIEYGESLKDVKEFKGTIGHKGIVKGKARVLKTSQVSDFQQGDILVTGMTTPDFIHIMKKASAIITDEGGITSHAVIVSRELNKPCLIGTKIATKVLHDGDLIEVDANKGIVKVIKRA